MSNKKTNRNAHQAGKGDAPRNCFSHSYRENYNDIDWGEENSDNIKKRKKSYKFKKVY